MPTKKKTSSKSKRGGSTQMSAKQQAAIVRKMGGSMGPQGIYYGGAWYSSFGDFWDAIKEPLKKVGNFIKDNQLISKGADFFGAPSWIGNTARKLGVGKTGGRKQVMFMIPSIRV